MSQFLLDDFLLREEIHEKHIQFVNRFDDAENTNKYIFGINVYTNALLGCHKVDAIIDDFYPETHYQGIRVLTLDSLVTKRDKNESRLEEPLVLCTSGGKPLSAMTKLEKLGFNCLHYFDYRKISNHKLPEIVMNEDFKNEFISNFHEFKWVFEKLEDQESKALFYKLVRFRYLNELSKISDFSESQENQYFENFLHFNSPICFLDIGSFDGKTTRKFIENFPTFHSVIAFEPETENYALCKKNLAETHNRDRVKILNLGLGNTPGEYEITGSSSVAQVNRSSTVVIPSQEHKSATPSPVATILRLDDLALANGSLFPKELHYFMKLDIEGMEIDAILGAREFIQNFKVSIAVCVYHRPDHFWRIAKLILEIDPSFRVYVRHYTESVYETVMYFVP